MLLGLNKADIPNDSPLVETRTWIVGIFRTSCTCAGVVDTRDRILYHWLENINDVLGFLERVKGDCLLAHMSENDWDGTCVIL